MQRDKVREPSKNDRKRKDKTEDAILSSCL